MKLLTELRASGRIFGTCPICGSEFPMKDAGLFAAADEFPEEALVRIAAVKVALRDRKRQIATLRQRMTLRAAATAESVNLGKIIEKIVPSFAGFAYRPRDCRALYEPIDFLIFEGLTAAGNVESLTFLDVKTGNARLTDRQYAIADAVNSGRVGFSFIAEPTED